MKNPFETDDGIVIYEDMSEATLLNFMNKCKHVKLLLTSDGILYAWNGNFKTHDDIMKVLGIYDCMSFNLRVGQFSYDEVFSDIYKYAKKYKRRKK